MKKFLALLLTLAIAVSLAACGSSASSSSNSGSSDGTPAKDSLTVGWTRSVADFEPAFSNNYIGMNLVYETLFVNNPDTGEIEGLLAESYEWVDDTTLNITLKDGIVFSDGDPLTPEDVIWSMKYYVDVGSNLSTYYAVYDWDNCEVIDDTHFTLKYSEPYGPAISYLTLPRIQNKSYYEEYGDDAFWDSPCGTGPYSVVENVEGSYTSYTLRDDYWDSSNMPEVRDYTVKSYPEATTMYIDFENGDLDIAFLLDESDAERAEEDGYNVTIQSALDVKMLCMNNNVEAFQNDLVRQAIAEAVEWDQVGLAAYGILCSPATSVLPEGCNYKIDVGTYTYDPDHAKELMEEAGYASGFDVRLVLVSDTTNQRMAEAIQSYLSVIGINLNIESYDIATAVPMFMGGETDMLIKTAEGGANALEPDQILDTLKASSTNTAIATHDATFDSYLMDGLYTIDENVRAQMYADAQQYCYDSCWYIPICEDSAAFVCADGISLNTIVVSLPDLRFVHVG